MDLLLQFLDILLHLDRYLVELIAQYGTWIYLILFLIIFCETGLVVTPFLPGDSLLFVAGAVAATGAMDVTFLIPLLIAAAFMGDNTNYWVGRFVGPRVFSREDPSWLNRKHLAHAAAIRSFRPADKGRLAVTLEPAPSEPALVSQERAGVFREWMERRR